MILTIFINDVLINTENVYIDKINDNGKKLHKIGFDFKVKVPAKDLEFTAVIHSYSTSSITTLYKKCCRRF